MFVGGLWASGRLRPGGDVACSFKGRFKRDVAPLLPKGTPAWVHCDAAYCRWEFVECVRGLGWDLSVSVTDANKCRLVLERGGGSAGGRPGGHRRRRVGDLGALPSVEVEGGAELRGDLGEPRRPAAPRQMAHLLLHAVQFRLLPKAARRHGIRPLARHVMRTVARLVRNGRKLSLLFASCCLRPRKDALNSLPALFRFRTAGGRLGQRRWMAG